jgi:hypothetical protein
MKPLAWVFSELLWFGLVVALRIYERANIARGYVARHEPQLYRIKSAVVRVAIVLCFVIGFAAFGAAFWGAYVERMW